MTPMGRSELETPQHAATGPERQHGVYPCREFFNTFVEEFKNAD
jgi:hypothetical protein